MLNHHLFYSLLRLPSLLKEDRIKYKGVFPYKGIILFQGEQGSGKTISMVEFAKCIKEKYPESTLMSNTFLSFQDIDISSDIMPLIETYKGNQGIIACLDEIQLWFNSKSSNKFPPQVLQVITQNRKNRRLILCTAQNLYMLSKDIRSQITEVRNPITLFGCFTLVFCFTPTVDGDGKIIKSALTGFYFFIHSKDLRESYDTLKAIQSYDFDQNYFNNGGFQ